MDSEAWQNWFEINQQKEYFRVPSLIELRDTELQRELGDVLAWFQRGETGEGRIVHEAKRSGDPLAEPAFLRALELYIAEEGKHARQLGRLVRALGAQPLQTLHAESAFRRIRRALGFRHKMLVLTVAEVIGLVFYEMTALHVDHPAIRLALYDIAADERKHLRLQIDFFRTALERTPKALRPLHRLGIESVFGTLLLGGTLFLFFGRRAFFDRAGISLEHVLRHTLRVLLQSVCGESVLPTPLFSRDPEPSSEHTSGLSRNRQTSAAA